MIRPNSRTEPSHKEVRDLQIDRKNEHTSLFNTTIVLEDGLRRVETMMGFYLLWFLLSYAVTRKRSWFFVTHCVSTDTVCVCCLSTIRTIRLMRCSDKCRCMVLWEVSCCVSRVKVCRCRWWYSLLLVYQTERTANFLGVVAEIRRWRTKLQWNFIPHKKKEKTEEPTRKKKCKHNRTRKRKYQYHIYYQVLFRNES